jgi:1,4-alpha-glucan branching enzyme
VEAVEGGSSVSGQPAYADIVVPPLATVWFRHDAG